MKITKTILTIILLALLVTISATNLSSQSPIARTGQGFAYFAAEAPAIPPLQDFVNSIINGDASSVVGVYVAGVMALPIVQQPSNQTSYVSTRDGEVTQFGIANQFNTIGLLAHNYLAGQHFFQLVNGQDIVVIFGDGSYTYYQIDEIQSYQALSPTSIYSDFVSVDNPSQRFTSTDIFYRTYGQGNNLVLQTCIKNGSDYSWGRLFIMAHPKVESVITSSLELQRAVKIAAIFEDELVLQ